MKRLTLLPSFLAACAGLFWPAGPAIAAPAVTVGVSAPPLVTGAFQQGDPVKNLEPGKVYLIDFWGSWCAPCRVTIPRLDKLQKKYADKGLIIIGQDIAEPDPAAATAFIAKMGGDFTYRSATDVPGGDGLGKMHSSWLEASGIRSIPTAFLINKEGKIAWIGQPLSLKEDVLESVLAGTQDLAAAAKTYEEQRVKDDQVSMLINRTRLEIAAHAYDEAETDIKLLEPLTAQTQPFVPRILRLELACRRPDLPVATDLVKKFAADFGKNAGLVITACTLVIDVAKDDRPTLEAVERILDALPPMLPASVNEKNSNLLIQRARVKHGLQKKEEAVALAKEAVASAQVKSREGVKKMLEGVLPADTP